MPVLFEVGMLLKGKRADFAQKGHLPCYGGGCSGCEKALVFTLCTSGLVWSDSIKRAQMITKHPRGCTVCMQRRNKRNDLLHCG